eukprot:gene5440-6595_t
MTTEHPWHPTDEVPSLKKTLSKLATCKEANRDKEKFLNEISESWYTDDREIQFAKEPPTTISKLGFVTKHGDLTHVRAITGCELPPSVTNSWNLPALGNPQLKIYDLAATKKESIAQGSAHLLPTLRGQNHRRRDVHTRTFNIVKKEGEDCKGHLVERITKGTRNEKPTDATLRECIFLETTSVAAAQQLICDTVYDWGHDSKAIRLPSKAEDDTAGRREVAIIDPSQQVFIQHRKQLAANEAINRVESKAEEVLERAEKSIGKSTSAGSVATPETKRLLKRIDAKLGNLNQQTKESANTLEGLQIQHDKNAERRHRELTDGVDSFH